LFCLLQCSTDIPDGDSFTEMPETDGVGDVVAQSSTLYVVGTDECSDVARGLTALLILQRDNRRYACQIEKEFVDLAGSVWSLFKTFDKLRKAVAVSRQCRRCRSVCC
jgi:hypothetical protein